MTRTFAAPWLPHLHEYGYALVPDVLGGADVARILAALDDAGEADADGVRRKESVYAIRNLLEVVPEIRALARSAAVRALVEPVLGAGAFAVRGILFDKTPDANWKVAWHQDLTIAVRERREVEGFGPWSEKTGACTWTTAARRTAPCTSSPVRTPPAASARKKSSGGAPRAKPSPPASSPAAPC